MRTRHLEEEATMTPVSQIPPLQVQTSGPGRDDGGGHPRGAPLLRHYLEMVVAMFVGMAVVGGLLTVAGLASSEADAPELAALEMAFSMSAGMVVWMRHRGHGWPGTLEMSGAMFAPALALFPLLWLDVISGSTLIAASHVLMLPLMLVVMLRRRDEHRG